MKKVYCCVCMEYKSRQQLYLKWNPYYFKRKLYCRDCNCGALILK